MITGVKTVLPRRDNYEAAKESSTVLNGIV